MEIAGQAISILAALLSIVAFQIKKNKPYFIMQIVIGVCFATSYVFLGALSATLLNVVNLVRGVIMARKKGKNDKLYLIILNVLYTACGLLGILVFPMPNGINRTVFIAAVIATVLANIAGTLSYWTHDGKKIRIVQAAFVSPCWIFNNCVVGSVGGVACEIFNMISIGISFARYGINGFENEDNESQLSKVETNSK